MNSQLQSLNTMRKLILAIVVAAFAFAVGSPTQAGIFTLNAVDSGWHLNDGLHQATNENYIVGRLSQEGYRNWFVFDLSSVTGTITSAQLRLSNPINGFTSVDGSETYTLFDVSTSIAALTADNSGASGIAIFSDLGTGSSFGSRSVTAADNNTIVSTSLNANAIASLNATSGQWAIGGSITTISFLHGLDEFLFGSTDINDDVRQLVLETQDLNPVPEPSSLVLLSLGAIGAFGAARRRRNAH